MSKRIYWLLLCIFGALPWLIGNTVYEAVYRTWSGRDFDDLWLAARMTLSGHGSDVFDIARFQQIFLSTYKVTSTVQIYSYPPHGLFLAVPFGLLPYPAALIAWNALTLGFFLWAARPFMAMPWWVIAFSPAAISCMVFGQYGLLTSGLFLLAFRGSGLAAAVLTFKPQIGFLVAVRLLREPKGLAVAIAATALLVTASVIAFGLAAWTEFFANILPHQFARTLGGNDAWLVGKVVTPMFTYGIVGQLIFASAATVMLIRCFNVFTAATATFLITPYALHYDMAAACLGFAYLLATRDLELWRKVALILAFCVPAVVTTEQWAAAPVLLLALFVQSEECRLGPIEQTLEGDLSIVRVVADWPSTLHEKVNFGR